MIVAEGLHRTYGDGPRAVRALRGASVTVPEGAIVALTGPSGSGKTTLLNCVAGLDRPTDGSVTVGGTEVHDLGDEEVVAWRRSNVALIFQTPGLLPYLTARENVDIGLRARGVSAAVRRDAIDAILNRLGLAEHRDHRPDELSGGQQQRVAVARALAVAPTILVADEPTGELDSDTTEIVLAEIRRAAAESRTSVLLTTHDLVVAQSADHHLALVDGVVQESS